jgi:hypothetical protein
MSNDNYPIPNYEKLFFDKTFNEFQQISRLPVTENSFEGLGDWIYGEVNNKLTRMFNRTCVIEKNLNNLAQDSSNYFKGFINKLSNPFFSKSFKVDNIPSLILEEKFDSMGNPYDWNSIFGPYKVACFNTTEALNVLPGHFTHFAYINGRPLNPDRYKVYRQQSSYAIFVPINEINEGDILHVEFKRIWNRVKFKEFFITELSDSNIEEISPFLTEEDNRQVYSYYSMPLDDLGYCINTDTDDPSFVDTGDFLLFYDTTWGINFNSNRFNYNFKLFPRNSYITKRVRINGQDRLVVFFKVPSDYMRNIFTYTHSNIIDDDGNPLVNYTKFLLVNNSSGWTFDHLLTNYQIEFPLICEADIYDDSLYISEGKVNYNSYESILSSYPLPVEKSSELEVQVFEPNKPSYKLIPGRDFWIKQYNELISGELELSTPSEYRGYKDYLKELSQILKSYWTNNSFNVDLDQDGQIDITTANLAFANALVDCNVTFDAWMDENYDLGGNLIDGDCYQIDDDDYSEEYEVQSIIFEEGSDNIAVIEIDIEFVRTPSVEDPSLILLNDVCYKVTDKLETEYSHFIYARKISNADFTLDEQAALALLSNEVINHAKFAGNLIKIKENVLPEYFTENSIVRITGEQWAVDPLRPTTFTVTDVLSAEPSHRTMHLYLSTNPTVVLIPDKIIFNGIPYQVVEKDPDLWNSLKRIYIRKIDDVFGSPKYFSSEERASLVSAIGETVYLAYDTGIDEELLPSEPYIVDAIFEDIDTSTDYYYIRLKSYNTNTVVTSNIIAGDYTIQKTIELKDWDFYQISTANWERIYDGYITINNLQRVIDNTLDYNIRHITDYFLENFFRISTFHENLDPNNYIFNINNFNNLDNINGLTIDTDRYDDFNQISISSEGSRYINLYSLMNSHYGTDYSRDFEAPESSFETRRLHFPSYYLADDVFIKYATMFSGHIAGYNQPLDLLPSTKPVGLNKYLHYELNKNNLDVLLTKTDNEVLFGSSEMEVNACIQLLNGEAEFYLFTRPHIQQFYKVVFKHGEIRLERSSDLLSVTNPIEAEVLQVCIVNEPDSFLNNEEYGSFTIKVRDNNIKVYTEGSIYDQHRILRINYDITEKPKNIGTFMVRSNTSSEFKISYISVHGFLVSLDEYNEIEANMPRRLVLGRYIPEGSTIKVSKNDPCSWYCLENYQVAVPTDGIIYLPDSPFPLTKSNIDVSINNVKIDNFQLDTLSNRIIMIKPESTTSLQINSNEHFNIRSKVIKSPFTRELFANLDNYKSSFDRYIDFLENGIFESTSQDSYTYEVLPNVVQKDWIIQHNLDTMTPMVSIANARDLEGNTLSYNSVEIVNSNEIKLSFIKPCYGYVRIM